MSQERTEIEEQYKWRVEDIYATSDEWESDLEELRLLMGKIPSMKGHIADSADSLHAFMEISNEIDKKGNQLATYAHLLVDQDLRDTDNQERQKRLELVFVDYSQATSFVDPELSLVSDERLMELERDERLKEYHMTFDAIRKQRAHVLSDKEEEVLSKTSILGDVPSDTYDILTDAEMPWPTMKLSDGKEVRLDHAEFVKQRESSVREDRQESFNKFWDTYKSFEGTIGELMAGHIREDLFSTVVRNFGSTLESRLYYKDIPLDVYDSLVKNINASLPTFHRYLSLRKRILGVEQLEYWDLYAPVVKDIDLKYTYQEAQSLILEAVKPLGEEYSKVIRRAFDERWIDVMPNEGKASGAYSTGGAYDIHPYILTNFNGSLNSVSTLIHELGHTMHSYLSNKNQKYHNSHYMIFVAEVASTLNECLLDELMLQKLEKREEKISLLMNILDGYKGTLFRQTQFAEFEREMHAIAQRKEPITGKKLSSLYIDILKKYYGHEKDVCHVDDKIAIEWAFIPHFYRSFYVYQYSTSFVASHALVNNILSGDKESIDRYLTFLSSGGIDYPIALLQKAGVDMLQSTPFENVIRHMNELMDKIESLLKE
ncbi:MAG: oligoendopeptidase F [Marinilabiliaceae bacterium]|nr:oligoendopeptidase F [Marinilabiliaceae bacterium]